MSRFSDATLAKMSTDKLGEKNPMWKGGRVSDGHGYIRVMTKTGLGAKGYELEHRVVVEKHFGRKLKSTEHVHHINGIKSDNRIDNLKVLTKSEHHSLHNRKMFFCSIEGCHKKHRSKGYCAVHYNKKFGYGGYSLKG